MRPSKARGSAEINVGTLMHALEVRQAELELQNQELITGNEELRRSNLALAIARDRYHVLHDLAPAPLVTVDTEGQVLDINGAAERLLRTLRHLVVDRPLALFVDPVTRPTLRALLTRLFAGYAAEPTELSLVVDGADACDVVVDGVLFREEGRAHVVLAFVDLTERKRVEEERHQIELGAAAAQRLESLGVLAGGIAHDFNNLLTVVLSGTDYVLRALDGSPLAEQLTQVRQAARQAGEFAHQMLAYSGHASTPPRDLDLPAIVRDLEPLIRASAKTTPVNVVLPRTPAWITGDETQLRQVVLNLVINAAEAMVGRSGAITITITTGPRVLLEVSDQGGGMDAATRARIFEPYYSTKFVGRGLGLAVVQGIVRGHGGEMSVESEVDRGTTFRVYLPPGTPAPDVGVAATPSGEPRRFSGRLLVVDDEPLIVRLAERILADFGFEVLTATDGAEAIEVFRTEGARIDLVLMDLAMPNMGGVDAAQAIHELRADVPIVLVTGYGEIPPEAGSSFVAMLAKPFDVTEMHNVIAKHVRPTTSGEC